MVNWSVWIPDMVAALSEPVEKYSPDINRMKKGPTLAG